MQNELKFDFEDKKYKVRKPTIKELQEAQKVYNQAFRDALSSGAMMRLKLDDVLEEQGLWDEDKQVKLQTLRKEVVLSERALSKGGTVEQGKEHALKLKAQRQDLQELMAVRSDLDNNTAEGQADNMKFNYLTSVCVVDEAGKACYKSLDDYLNNGGDDFSLLAAKQLAFLLYGLDNTYEENLIENKFLKSFGFVNDKLQLVNDEGKLIDEEGHFVDELGRIVNEDGHLIDDEGNVLNESGQYEFNKEVFTTS